MEADWRTLTGCSAAPRFLHAPIAAALGTEPLSSPKRYGFPVYMRPKPERCAQCQAPIEQARPPDDRARCVYRQTADRKAAAERLRVHRRRTAAIPLDGWRYDRNRQSAPRGGHQPLVRRLARQFAVEAFPHASVTTEELDALELAIQAGAVTSDDIEHIVKGRDPTAYPPSGRCPRNARPVEGPD